MYDVLHSSGIVITQPACCKVLSGTVNQQTYGGCTPLESESYVLLLRCHKESDTQQRVQRCESYALLRCHKESETQQRVQRCESYALLSTVTDAVCVRLTATSSQAVAAPLVRSRGRALAALISPDEATHSSGTRR